MRMSAVRALQLVIVSHAVFFLLADVACAQRRRVLTEEKYITLMGKGLDEVSARTRWQRQHPLEFSANLFFAHEVFIEHFPLEVLKKKVDAFRELGLQRIDINMGLFPWRDKNREVIAKYDALIQHIRQAGLKLVINPQYSDTYHKVASFEDWKSAVLPVYAEIARRYQPEILVVIHEPTVMEKRMGETLSPADWREFAREAARVVKKESPRTRCGAGGLYTEKAHFEQFLSLEEIDVLTLDIYNLAGLRTYNQMIRMARRKGKPVYIEETWRPPYYVPEGRKKEKIEVISAKGIGKDAFQDLDVKWLQTMTQYASVSGLEAITVSWTQPLFKYVSDEGDALSPQYNRQVAEAIGKGERTETYHAYRQLVRQFGRGVDSPKRGR